MTNFLSTKISYLDKILRNNTYNQIAVRLYLIFQVLIGKYRKAIARIDFIHATHLE
jgi:hypothetical protein